MEAIAVAILVLALIAMFGVIAFESTKRKGR